MYEYTGNGRKIVEPTWSQHFSDTNRLSWHAWRRCQSFGGIVDSGSWHVAAALLADMKDVTASVCFEKCETTFRCSIYSARSGGSSAVGTSGSKCIVESQGEVEEQEVVTRFRREI